MSLVIETVDHGHEFSLDVNSVPMTFESKLGAVLSKAQLMDRRGFVALLEPRLPILIWQSPSAYPRLGEMVRRSIHHIFVRKNLFLSSTCKVYS